MVIFNAFVMVFSAKKDLFCLNGAFSALMLLVGWQERHLA